MKILKLIFNTIITALEICFLSSAILVYKFTETYNHWLDNLDEEIPITDKWIRVSIYCLGTIFLFALNCLFWVKLLNFIT